jgi:hypothetical protein
MHQEATTVIVKGKSDNATPEFSQGFRSLYFLMSKKQSGGWQRRPPPIRDAGMLLAEDEFLQVTPLLRLSISMQATIRFRCQGNRGILSLGLVPHELSGHGMEQFFRVVPINCCASGDTFRRGRRLFPTPWGYEDQRRDTTTWRCRRQGWTIVCESFERSWGSKGTRAPSE